MKLVLDKEKIEELRLRCGMLKMELARKAKLSVNSVVNATAGKPVGVIAARKIAAALEVSLVEIIANVTGGEQRVAVG